MMKLIITILSVILVGLIVYKPFSQSSDTNQQSVRVEGVYKLLSETTTLKKPQAATTYRKSPGCPLERSLENH